MIVEWLVYFGFDDIVNDDDDVESFLRVFIQFFFGLFNILFGLNEEVNVKFEVSSIVDFLFQVINNVIENY